MLNIKAKLSNSFQTINVSANGAGEYSFGWAVPSTEGTYIVETSLAPTQLTAYDAKWLQAGESTSGSTGLSAHGFDLSQNLVIYTFAFLFLATQSSDGIYSTYLIKHKGKDLRFYIMRQEIHNGALQFPNKGTLLHHHEQPQIVRANNSNWKEGAD